jgi:hypothetical protein
MTIHRKKSRDELIHVLGAQYGGRLPPNLPEPITVVVVPNDVVNGRVARKALERVGSDFGASLVFAARAFTVEARTAGKSVVTLFISTMEAIIYTDEDLLRIGH